MKNFSLKALGASLLTMGLVLAGVALPAQAATMTSPSATSTGSIGTSGTNTSPITVTATTVSAPGSGATQVDFYTVVLPTGWTFTSQVGGPNCNYSQFSFSGLTTTNGCGVTNNNGNVNGKPTLTFFASGIPAQSTIQVTFNPGFLNVANSSTFSMFTSYSNWTSVDSATADLVAAPAPAPAPVPEPDTLATTGFDGMPYLFSGLALALSGGALLFAARRKRSN